MKAYLMHREQDFDPQQPFPPNEPALVQDLELEILFDAMARGDKFLLEVIKKAVLSSQSDLENIRYRQTVLKDCLKNPEIVREIYEIAVDSIDRERKTGWGIFSKYPPAILSRSIEVMRLFVETLTRLRAIADEKSGLFDSEAFQRFFRMLQDELTDDYFGIIQEHLKELELKRGVLVSAQLGKGNKGTNYVLRKMPPRPRNLLERFLGPKPLAYTFYIADRDDAGSRAVAKLKDLGINLVANALAQSCDHILSFFKMVRTELAFYIGCLNLKEQLETLGEPICFPEPLAKTERHHDFIDLYDVCLALKTHNHVVGNDVDADQKNLVVITGANQGGKSTFLRSIGQAQLMMQCGMFAPAQAFSANVCDGIFTHFKREEDASMNSGKLDEELGRMNEIMDWLSLHSLLLFNESFAATNEREGSEIARQIVTALLEENIKIFFVTHLYEFAHNLYDKRMANAIFLRAERQPDGSRTYKLAIGEPLQTSFGQDVYKKVFGAEPSAEFRFADQGSVVFNTPVDADGYASSA